ncbi:MAG: DUF1493 family protein [Limibaculum sp.]
MGQQSHFDRVRGLVSGHSGVPASEITMETRLVEDLGMDGDTGHELLEAFEDEFGVEMSRMAPFNYFDDEPPLYWFSAIIPFLAFLSPMFRRYVKRATRGRRAVTVRNLVASARAGTWIRPVHRRTDIDPTRMTWKSVLMMAFVIPLFSILIVGAIQLVLESDRDGMFARLLLLAIIPGLLALKFAMALHWLRRLDAAATYEEQSLSAKD